MKKNQCLIELSDVLYIDSSGRDIIIHTEEGIFRINETLENLERKLPPNDFSRVSKSTIIRRTAIKKISPSFQMRFRLTIKNNDIKYNGVLTEDTDATIEYIYDENNSYSTTGELKSEIMLLSRYLERLPQEIKITIRERGSKLEEGSIIANASFVLYSINK